MEIIEFASICFISQLLLNFRVDSPSPSRKMRSVLGLVSPTHHVASGYTRTPAFHRIASHEMGPQ
ncbi:hypothetical protein BDZ94DRAFT_1253470 [Collybia nuda]|uniref:Uncharacterized protein n=1 Tax=Collybia nuda TaxID=64659 RepID=A0A9P6CKQ5_9AGAR|nr:hypothetical protein BDZ94DRAFT_1253470 [Collybia nuda]